MCIVIDTNAFASVFKKTASDHAEFRPVLDWITSGRGKMVYGGEKYQLELTRAPRYLALVAELHRQGKAKRVCRIKVDAEQKRIENIVDPDEFDDAHLMAIVIVSGCRLICSKDRSCYRFLRRKDLYPKHIRRPRIYSGARNRELLCDRYVAPCCK